jgi:uncharacterized protein with GYD domain
MPRYLLQATYTSAAIATFVANPQDRTAGAIAIATKMGGKMESLYFSLGDYDIIAVMELPDDIAAAAMALAICAPGHIKSYKTTRLLSSAEFVAAQQKAHNAGYQPPAKA